MPRGPRIRPSVMEGVVQQTQIQAYPPEGEGNSIDDLRDLFGSACSAKHLLAGHPAKVRRLALRQAVEGAAIRRRDFGTTPTAMQDRRTASLNRIDLNYQIMGLEPMIGALAVQSVEFDLCDDFLPVRVDVIAMDAALFELLANGRGAGATSITIRTRRAGRRVWLIIADNGCGMAPATLARVCRCEDHARADVTGLCRVRQLAHEAHGAFRVRGRSGVGTVVSICLPAVLKLAAL